MMPTARLLLKRAPMLRLPPQKPVIAIVGATGTGKSQLAVELARRFDGEIINTDAMQLYEGLPVITNKIADEEKMGVPHHLLGSIGFDDEPWTVGEFVKRALGVIDGIRARGRLPILVGGTHYYVQSLLFKDALAGGADGSEKDASAREDAARTHPILDEPTEIILAKLREVDPVMADRWHPNDRRKIQRSLEIWLKTGKAASQTYEEQSLREQMPTAPDGDDQSATGSGRFPSLLLWVHAASEPLRARLDGRVEKMLADGLLAEVAALDEFLSEQEAAGKPVDRTRGIWVSIGYKEFEAYQRALRTGDVGEKELQKLRAQAVEQVQAATRQYAKRQVRWIRIKLIHALARAQLSNSLFLLDGSDLTRWEDAVEKPALELAEQFLAGQVLPDPRHLSEAAKEMLTPTREYELSKRRDLWARHVCETCDMVATTESDWNNHIKSRGHKFREKKRERNEKGMDGPRKEAGRRSALAEDVADEPMQSSSVERSEKAERVERKLACADNQMHDSPHHHNVNTRLGTGEN